MSLIALALAVALCPALGKPAPAFSIPAVTLLGRAIPLVAQLIGAQHAEREARRQVQCQTLRVEAKHQRGGAWGRRGARKGTSVAPPPAGAGGTARGVHHSSAHRRVAQGGREDAATVEVSQADAPRHLEVDDRLSGNGRSGSDRDPLRSFEKPRGCRVRDRRPAARD